MRIDITTRFRHDLRTQVNHIFGYSQLLIEEADRDNNDPSGLPSFQQVSSLAKDMLKTLELLIPSSGNSISERHLMEVRKELERPLQQIQLALQSLALPEDAPQTGDVKKILHATSILLRFVTSGSLDSPHQGPSAHEPTSTSHEPKPAPAQLLVVDDDLGNREVLGRMLSRLNYEVSLAADGAEAIHLIQRHKYDLILLDIVLPGLSGYDVLRQLKAAIPELPVVMISAVGEVESLIQCIELGAEDYFLKPFEPRLLRARISAVLNRNLVRDSADDKVLLEGKLRSVNQEIKIPLNLVMNLAELALGTLNQLRATMGPRNEGIDSLLAELSQSLASIKMHGARAEQAAQNLALRR